MPTMRGSVPDDPHKDVQARYFRAEISRLEAVVFLFHGRGGSGESVYEMLGQHLLRDNVLIVVPEAYSNCWYPYRFNEPVKVNQPWLDSAIGWIHREVTMFLERGIAPEQMLFGGFSQGSCLALEYPLRYPKRYGGLFCLSGGVIGPEGERNGIGEEALSETPVFLGCADQDEWIPRAKFDESATLLAASGARVEATIYEGLGHAICDEELQRVRAMLGNVLERVEVTA